MSTYNPSYIKSSDTSDKHEIQTATIYMNLEKNTGEWLNTTIHEF